MSTPMDVHELAGWVEQTPEDVWREVQRARREEARLLEDNREKAEQVKALADALEAAKMAMWRGEFGDKGRDKHVPEQVDAALRLAGRVK